MQKCSCGLFAAPRVPHSGHWVRGAVCLPPAAWGTTGATTSKAASVCLHYTVSHTLPKSHFLWGSWEILVGESPRFLWRHRHLCSSPLEKERKRWKKISFVGTGFGCIGPYFFIAHHRFGSSSDPTLNGTLHYPNPNDIDRSLNEAAADKIRKYRSDYNNNPPNAISFMTTMAGTSGRLHSEFIRLLFLQAHRETDRFFAASGVQSAQSTWGHRTSTYAAPRSLRWWSQNADLFLWSQLLCVLILTWTGRLSPLSHILTHRTRKLIDC